MSDVVWCTVKEAIFIINKKLAKNIIFKEGTTCSFYCTDDTVDLEQYPYHVRDVHISDPFILADPKSRCYYTYVQFADTERFPDVETDKEHGVFYVLESKDLIHWSKPQICFRQNNFWADKDYWAPEVHIWKGRYYLFSSFRADGHYRKCQCLVSDSPKGPFEPHSSRSCYTRWMAES